MENQKIISKKNKFAAGFTIIELLVVVSIIAVLAAIVLVNVASYITKGKNAAIRGNMSSILTNSAVHYDLNSNYNGFCGSAYVANPKAAVENVHGSVAAAGFACNCDVTGCGATSTKFCAIANLLNEGGVVKTFCVDQTGAKKEVVGGTCSGTAGCGP